MHDFIMAMLGLGLGLVLGAVGVWVAMRGRLSAEAQLADRFKALAADTLRQNNESFLQLAESRLKQSEQAAAATLERKTVAVDDMVKPVKESLQKMDAQLQALEVKREGAYRELMESVKISNEAQKMLRGETSQLLQALRAPTSRGRWGEMQLRRILEMTGMAEYAKDFSAQHTLSGDNGALRPDYIVNLPNHRCLIIDSKVPLTAFMEAMNTTDDVARLASFRQHARHVREHVKALSAKTYWSQVDNTAEFVLLFMPGEHFLNAALEHDLELLEFSIGQNVVFSTPSNLVALLRTVANGWKQETLRDNFMEIGKLGSQLYDSIFTMVEHIEKLGLKLTDSAKSYNAMIGSLERNVLSKARRLKSFGATKDDTLLPDALEPVDLQPRHLSIGTAIAEDDAA